MNDVIAHCLSHGYLRNLAALFVHHFFASWPLVLLEDQKQGLPYGITLKTIKKESQVNARSRLSKVMKKRNVTGQLEGRKNPTNFKQHMSKSHPDQYAQLLETNSAK